MKKVQLTTTATYFGLGIVWLLSLLPIRVIRACGNILGVIGYYCVGSRRKVGLKNLSLCFPEMPLATKQRIIKDHFKCLVTSALEYGLVFYANKAKLNQVVKYKNVEYLTDVYNQKPLILLCPHFVGLDLAALRMTVDFVGYSMYSRQKNSLITEKLANARVRFIKDKGGAVFARQDGLRPLIRKLRQGKHIFYYLPDQDFGAKDSIFVPFFNYPDCATVKVLPQLVKMTNAVVVPMCVYRTAFGYEIEYFKPWDNYATDDLEKDVTYMNKFIESVVKDHIEEYYWLHKRFKTQPGVEERGLLYKNLKES